MHRLVRAAALPAATAMAALASLPAAAQTTLFAQVSRGGTDSGSCATNPCRTLGYAISQTASRGRIVCLDSANYGDDFTITRSVTIDCAQVNAIVASAAGTVITIDDSTASPGTIDVVIRGLIIEGYNAARSGIAFESGFSLTLEDVQISNFNNPDGALGATVAGIYVAVARAARLEITNSAITNNGGQSGGGVSLVPVGVGYVNVLLENVRLSRNRSGLIVFPQGTTATSSTNVVVNRSVVSGSTANGVRVLTASDRPAAGVTITNSTINGNNDAGISASGAPSQVRVENSTIAGNSTGLRTTSGAIIASYGNNALIGNGVNGAFNGFPTEN